MANIKQLVENKSKLDYPALCRALIEQFAVTETVNWESILPAPQQQELFGGEVLRLVATHPQLANQKDIRPIALKKGSTSQMLFFFVCLADSSLPKKHIEQITKRFIKGTEANRYIIWFFGNTAATELKVVLSGREGKKVVLKTLPFGIDQPYYKTYDFIFTEVSAKVQQFFVEPTDLWKALWKAFDISIVNKRFYEEIKKAFDGLTEQLSAKGNPFKTNEDRVQFAIRLIGRIIFCWFLKRKNILKEEVLSASAVNNKTDYYHALLEPLFFEVMNKPVKERPAGLPKLIAHYPFLNGGLFDAQDTDFYNNKPDYRINIADNWFYTFFHQTLEKYNFTVDENSSSNAEIAIDPEMLGRIFENLLAEQNPETGESARKATGSFYTPREIVDYMVEQSISEYLKTALIKKNEEPALEKDLFGVIPNQQLKLPSVTLSAAEQKLQEAIEDFVHTSHLPDELKPKAQSLLDALSSIKVLDPACGSGAFPIGVLQKIIALKQELVQAQNPKKQLTQTITYKLKLDTIQNSIYGVDIQPMAVELSRLRCWLSLVVDEENDNIKALPNLDFKFVCADSLVDVPEDEYVKNQSAKVLQELGEAIEKYFNPDYTKKAELKNTIKRCLNEITNVHDTAINSIVTQLRKERNSATSSRLKQLEKSLLDYTKQQSVWHSYRNLFENKKVDFFNLHYFFPSAKNGFDIVIGNPPYVQIQKLSEEIKVTLASQNYETFIKSGDIYQLFYERGIKLLTSKGHLVFITSNKWMRSEYGEVTRAYFSNNVDVKIVVDFGMAMIFESAIAYTNIIVLQVNHHNSLLKICRINKDFNLNIPLEDYLSLNAILIDHPRENSWVAYNKEDYLIIQKVKKKGIEISNWGLTINRGVLTGFNEAFIISSDIRNSLIKEDPKCSKLIKPILRGEDIKAYVPQSADLWLITTFPALKLNIDTYPSIKRHLLQYREKLEPKPKSFNGKWSGRKSGSYKWFEIQDATAYYREFEKPKIIFPNMTKYLPFVYDESGMITNQKCFILTGDNLKYLTSIFNSKLWRFSFKNYFPELLGDTYELSKVYFEKVPILKPEYDNEKNSLSLLVDYVMVCKKNISKLNEFVPNDHISKQFESLIDACVFELYFEKEVKAKEADVLTLVAEQFKPIEGLPEAAQVKMIQEGYQILRNSHNEIPQRITRQKLVEEIAIIQNSTQ